MDFSYSSKSYRVHSPATRLIMESRNVNFMRTPSCILPPPPEEISTQTIPSSNGMDDHNYSAPQTTTFCAISAITIGSWNLFPVRPLTTSPWAGSRPICRWLSCLGRISEITRRNVLVGGASELPPKVLTRESADGGRIAGGRCLTSGVAGVARDSPPGIITGWATAAPTTGTLASRRDTCGCACWQCSAILREVKRQQPFQVLLT